MTVAFRGAELPNGTPVAVYNVGGSFYDPRYLHHEDASLSEDVEFIDNMA